MTTIASPLPTDEGPYVITVVDRAGTSHAWLGWSFATEEAADEYVEQAEYDNPGCIVAVQSTEGP